MFRYILTVLSTWIGTAAVAQTLVHDPVMIKEGEIYNLFCTD